MKSMAIDDRSNAQLLFDFARVGERGAPSATAVDADLSNDASTTPPRARSQKAARLAQKPARPTRKPASPILAAAPRPPRGIDHARPSQQRFDAIVADFLERHPLRVKRWRSTLSGVAVLRIFRDGREERTIEAPYPTSALRLAIFLHEVGHHVLGLGVHRPRCLEEYLAWRYAIDRLVELGIAVEGPVARRFERSMQYAVAKAIRRGIRRLPVELLEFAPESVQRAVR
ncbi:MAG: hypothetical protein ACKO3W_15345, partial [bacterium]